MIGPRGGRWNPRFDFDGLVAAAHPEVPSARMAEAVAAGDRFLDGYGRTAPRDEYHRAVLAALGVDDPADDLLAALDAPLPASALVEVFPDVEPALADLRARGLRLAVVSNAWPQLEAIHVEEGLRDHFDAFVISAVLGCAKPDPRIYAAGSDGLGLAPAECVFVDDDADHVAAAVALGYRGLVIDRTGTGGDHGLPTIADLGELVAWATDAGGW
jgi:HAD superfamily hydrolase (TIGR01509 family)